MDLVEFDDFLAAKEGTGFAQVGKLGWNCSGTKHMEAGEPNHPGIYRLSTASGLVATSLWLGPQLGVGPIPTAHDFTVNWIFRVNTIDADTEVFCGLGDGGTPQLNDAVFLERVDTSWDLVTKRACQETRNASGVLVQAGEWLSLSIVHTGSQYDLTLNGQTTIFTTTLPMVESLSPFILLNANTPNIKSMDIDWFSLSIAGLVR